MRTLRANSKSRQGIVREYRLLLRSCGVRTHDSSRSPSPYAQTLSPRVHVV